MSYLCEMRRRDSRRRPSHPSKLVEVCLIHPSRIDVRHGSEPMRLPSRRMMEGLRVHKGRGARARVLLKVVKYICIEKKAGKNTTANSQRRDGTARALRRRQKGTQRCFRCPMRTPVTSRQRTGVTPSKYFLDRRLNVRFRLLYIRQRVGFIHRRKSAVPIC